VNFGAVTPEIPLYGYQEKISLPIFTRPSGIPKRLRRLNCRWWR